MGALEENMNGYRPRFTDTKKALFVSPLDPSTGEPAIGDKTGSYYMLEEVNSSVGICTKCWNTQILKYYDALVTPTVEVPRRQDNAPFGILCKDDTMVIDDVEPNSIAWNSGIRMGMEIIAF